MVPWRGIEPLAFSLGGRRSHPTELPGQKNGGAEEDRTPDLCIANATLSQLSYGPLVSHITVLHLTNFKLNGGAEEDRTPDLCIANATLSQLSYGPTKK